MTRARGTRVTSSQTARICCTCQCPWCKRSQLGCREAAVSATCKAPAAGSP